jgi:hypothetical protein
MNAVMKTKLEIIVRLLYEAKQELNLDGHACPSCGLMVRKDFQAWQWGQSIDSSITKLERIIYRGDTDDEQPTRLNEASVAGEVALQESERKGSDVSQTEKTRRRR